MPEVPEDAVSAGALRKARMKNTVLLVVLIAILIGGSGQVDWVEGWIYVLLVTSGPLATYLVVFKKSPDLLVERSRVRSGTKAWDKVLVPLIALVFPLAMWVLAALDKRYGRSGFPAAVQVAGFVLVVAGILLMLWAMATNRFFASTVRIQKDRGHTVVSRGPYAYVRHPGYVGLLGYALGTPLALDSVVALIPAVLCAATTILRTALEDRTLKAELDGYADYARRVRSRLIPAIW